MVKDVIDVAVENGFKIRVCDYAEDGSNYYELENKNGDLFSITIRRLN